MFIMLSYTVLGIMFPARQQEPEQERIVEQVTVTNVEVPVRVLYKGEPVTGLTMEDFTVWEDKKKVEINGFFMKRKQISVPASAGAVEAPQPAPRVFVLVFSITDFNDNVRKAVDHMLDNVLREDDRLLVFANDRDLEYRDIKDKEAIRKRLRRELRDQGRAARQRLITYINKVENLLNMNDFRVRIYKRDQRPERLLSFLKKYLLTWNDYKKRYLTPRLDRFYYFSRYLENIKAEKWVFNFYQFELFPRIRMASDTLEKMRELASTLIESKEAGEHAMGRLINTILNQLMVDLNIGKGVPTDEISKLFYKVDATFHSFFIRNLGAVGFNDLEYAEVASDIEMTLKDITRITGGQTITSNNLVESIDTVTSLEDVYYVITYVPRDPGKAGKLKIKVKNKKYKVLYDNNFRADYIDEYLKKLEKQIQTPDVKIVDFSFRDKILAFTVTDYFMRDADKGKAGQLKVRIRLTGKDDRSLFDQEKMLTAGENRMKISLGIFKKLKKGEYNFLIDASDMLTGKEANLHKNVLVKR
jgi:hypothetical protein